MLPFTDGGDSRSSIGDGVELRWKSSLPDLERTPLLQPPALKELNPLEDSAAHPNFFNSQIGD